MPSFQRLLFCLSSSFLMTSLAFAQLPTFSTPPKAKPTTNSITVLSPQDFQDAVRTQAQQARSTLLQQAMPASQPVGPAATTSSPNTPAPLGSTMPGATTTTPAEQPPAPVAATATPQTPTSSSIANSAIPPASSGQKQVYTGFQGTSTTPSGSSKSKSTKPSSEGWNIKY